MSTDKEFITVMQNLVLRARAAHTKKEERLQSELIPGKFYMSLEDTERLVALAAKSVEG